jgi:hypothetical protein
VIMEARIAWFPPEVEPRLRVLVSPEQLVRAHSAPVEGVELYAARGGARECHALLGREIVIGKL